MANSTLLTLVQQSLQGMGVVAYGLPSTVISNTNQDVVQTLALVNIEGNALAREYDWNALRIQNVFQSEFYSYTGDTTSGSTSLTNMSSIASLDATFQVTGTNLPQDSTVVSASGTTVVINQEATATATTSTFTFSKVRYAVPTAWDRPVDRTQWVKSDHWEMLGPETPQQQEWLRSGYISSGPRIRYWMMGGYFQIWPPLGTEETLSYEYFSKYWIFATAAANTSKQYFTVDTDTCVFPDSLMHALIRLKYFEVKGFDTTALYRDYLNQKDLAKSHDGGSPMLSMAPQLSSVLIGWENIPDSGFGT